MGLGTGMELLEKCKKKIVSVLGFEPLSLD
jgi:hypothetical protein